MAKKGSKTRLIEAASIAASILLVIVIGCCRMLYNYMRIFLCKLGRHRAYRFPFRRAFGFSSWNRSFLVPLDSLATGLG